MIIRKLMLVLALALTSFAATARQAPLENLAYRPFDSQGGREVAPANLRLTVTEALRAYNGAIVEEHPGSMTLRLAPRSHVANARLDYDAKGFNITYLSSTNLNYEKDRKGRESIHPNYNVWIRQIAEAVIASPKLWLAQEQLPATDGPKASEIKENNGTILIAEEIPFTPGVGTPALRQECNFGKLLSANIVGNGRNKIKASNAPLEGQPGQTLNIVITHVYAAGGGGMSGPKWARAKGFLREDGKLLGSFDMQRTTAALFRLSTCPAMKKVAEALGEDIAAWSRRPTIDPAVN